MKFFATVFLALFVATSAFAPAPTRCFGVKVLQAQENQNNEPGKLGAGGMADTRDPEPFVNESDKRQSISQAPSFEEYLKQRQ